MAVEEIYFVDKDNAGSTSAGCVIYTAQSSGFVKKDDTLKVIIDKMASEIKTLKKKVDKLES
jgi:outer membrane murein-binding lipoprotein Lpp